MDESDSYTTNSDGLGFGGISNAAATANEGSPYYGASYDPSAGSWVDSSGNAFYTPGETSSYQGYTTGQAYDPNSASYDPSLEPKSEWSLPGWFSRWGKGKASKAAGYYVPGGSLMTSPLINAATAPEGQRGQAFGAGVTNNVGNMALWGINPVLGLGNYLYGAATGNTLAGGLNSLINPSGATVTDKAALDATGGDVSYQHNWGGQPSLQNSVGQVNSGSGRGSFFGVNDALELGAGAMDDFWGGMGNLSSDTPTQQQPSSYDGYTTGQAYDVNSPAYDKELAPQPWYNSLMTSGVDFAKRAGNAALNNPGSALLGMYGLYQAEQQRKQVADMRRSLTDMYSPNGAYATQLRNKLTSQDAARGRRSNYAGRETQLMAELANRSAQLAPSMLNFSQQENKYRNDQLGTLVKGLATMYPGG